MERGKGHVAVEGYSDVRETSKFLELGGGGGDHNAVKSHEDDFRKIIMHMKTCSTNGSRCSYCCRFMQAILKNSRNCNNSNCRACFRVRNWQNWQKKRKETAPEISSVNGTYDTMDGSGSWSDGATKGLNQVQKRLKMDHALQSVPRDFGISPKPDVAYNGSRAQQPRISDVTQSVGATKGLNQVQKRLKMDHVLLSVPRDFGISPKPNVAYNGSRAQQPRISDVTRSVGATKGLNQVQKCLKMDHVLQSVPTGFEISAKPDVAYNGSRAQQPKISDATRSVVAPKGLNQVQKRLKMDHVLHSVPTDFGISPKPNVAYNGSRAQQPRISDVTRSVGATKGLNQVQKCLKMDHVLQSVPTDFEISHKPDVAYNGSRAQQPRIFDVTPSVRATKGLNQVQKRLKMDHVLQSVPTGFEISAKPDVAYNGSRAQQPKISDATRSVVAPKGLNQVQKRLKMDHVLHSVPTDFGISPKPNVAYNGSRAQQPRISDVTRSVGATKGLNQVQKCLKMDHVLQSVPTDFEISRKQDVAYNGSRAQQPRISDVTQLVGATKGLNQVQKCLNMDHVLQSVPTDFEISRKPDVAYNGSRAQQPRISDVTQLVGAKKGLNQVQKCLKMDHVLQSVPTDFEISRKPDVAYNGYRAQQPRISDVTQLVGATKGLNQVQKCLKMDHILQSVPTDFEISRKPDVAYNGSPAQQPRISDVTCMEIDTRVSPAKGFLCADNTSIGMSNDGSSKLITADKGIDQDKYVSATLPAENMGATKPKKPEAKVVSLIELFTPDQVREHIGSLKQCVGQSKPKTGKPQAMEQNPCQLCGVAKLNFEPIPIYCMPCGTRIKRNAKYYTAEAVESQQHICNFCYNQTPGDSIVVGGTPCPKARLEKQKNDKFIEEGWVQCDKCHAWQHQICALFNSRNNEGGLAKFTCPCCYIAEVERGECTPLQQSAVRGAKDLPRTSLSDHLEQRLLKKLKHERVTRARVQGKTYDEVPGAECLVVRVVSSVDKKLEVKKQFFETLKELNYPNEFPYKSKVILLFQKIEGVEVCLFAMIVQEFGANCQQPNHRSVYLSYMDSVKYFRPEIKAVTGEDLRTFVYHEILIGYLEHCKKRGFTSCYIWACPPIKGDDYIFYCHPEMQKTPKSDKLREWYITMLEKAAKENIVVELNNLYNHFFIFGGGSGECKVKVTAARLPYFDGDYFPGAAEDFIHQLQQEEGGILLNEKTTIKTIAKRALEEYGQADLSGNAAKDFLLMHKLREAISPKKEDFIMVHLQHSCSYCCTLMTSGNFWGCCQCKDFRLCDKCYEAEQKLEKGDRHPVKNQKDIHILYPIEVSGVPEDTQDNDEILGSKFFDTRLTFLGLCEGNHYQYDTLRRAKHSSMMLLHHLHNPNVPAFVPTTWSGDISPTP